jgi:hypothetical protein
MTKFLSISSNGAVLVEVALFVVPVSEEAVPPEVGEVDVELVDEVSLEVVPSLLLLQEQKTVAAIIKANGNEAFFI